MKKNSLQFELILKISIFFILFVIGVSSAVLIFTTNEYNKIIMENMSANMENVVDSIDYYFEDVKTPMVMMARNDNIIKAMKGYGSMTNREKLNTTNELKDFVQNITTFKSFINDIIIVGNNGYLYNIYNENTDKYLGSYNFATSVYLREAKEGPVRLYYVGEHPTDYYIHPPEGETVYSAALVVRSMTNRIGYIICDIKGDVINGILKNNLKEGSAKILVTDEKGRLIYEEGNEEIEADGVLEEAERRKTRGYDNKNLMEILLARDNYVTQVKSAVTGWTFLYAEPYQNFNGFVKKIMLFNLAALLIGLVVIVFFSRQLGKQVLTPLKNIAFMIREMKINQGNTAEHAFHPKGQNVKELSIEIEQMIRKIDHLISDNYVSELKARDARIQVLINQLSPHFLYNTLQLIEYQSYTNQQENVTGIINGLGCILRYSISNVNTVCLKEELNYIRSYLEIYRLRYRDKLHYEIAAKEDAEEAQVPKMLLEPLVENCIRHGFAGNFSGAMIRITMEIKGTDLEITVWDNGRGIEADRLESLRRNLQTSCVLGEHIGLNNVNAILRLRYGNQYGVRMESEAGAGTKVSLRLPFCRQGRENEKSIAGG